MISIDELNKYMESPEAIVKNEEYFQKLKSKQEKQKKNITRINNLSDMHFERLMNYVIFSNGDEWEEKCYKNGCEPYPTNLFYLLLETSASEGVEYDFGDDFGPFSYDAFIYRSYIFVNLYGQGCASMIFDDKKKRLI